MTDDLRAEIDAALDEFYEPDEKARWWTLPHPMLGNVSADDALAAGQGDDILRILRQLRGGSAYLMTDDLRERVALEWFRADYGVGADVAWSVPEAADWRDEAFAAADAILAEIGRTHAAVPKEPTEAMQDAMLQAVKDGIAVDDDAHRSIRHGYRAMLAAAPPLTRSDAGREIDHPPR